MLLRVTASGGRLMIINLDNISILAKTPQGACEIKLSDGSSHLLVDTFDSVVERISRVKHLH